MQDWILHCGWFEDSPGERDGWEGKKERWLQPKGCKPLGREIYELGSRRFQPGLPSVLWKYRNNNSSQKLWLRGNFHRWGSGHLQLRWRLDKETLEKQGQAPQALGFWGRGPKADQVPGEWLQPAFSKDRDQPWWDSNTGYAVPNHRGYLREIPQSAVWNWRDFQWRRYCHNWWWRSGGRGRWRSLQYPWVWDTSPLREM